MAENLPESCQVALKEWAGVCAALRNGRQSILLRKGGVVEESGCFRPEHGAFWLYPTQFHQEEQGLKEHWEGPSTPPAGLVPIDALAVVTEALYVDREEALEPWHVLTAETVRKRFHYRRPGLWVLAVRVHAGEEARQVPVTPAHAGCTSWVPLEAPLPTRGLRPVLGVDEYQGRVEALRRATTTAEQGD